MAPEHDDRVGTAPRPTFVPPPALASAQEVQTALRGWADASSALHLPGLALAVVDAAGPGQDHDGPDLARATYLLEAGRYTETLAELGVAGAGRPGRPDEVTYVQVLRATAEAALGDDAALGWLSAMASAHLHSEAAAFFATCLARVGAGRGDGRLRDAAHHQLGLLGVENREVSPEVAALMVRARDQDDLDAAQATLRDALGLLDRCSQSFATDPQPALDAADALVRDGDRAGALLLLSWVHRLAPKAVRTTAALRALPSVRPGPLRVVVLTVLWAAVLAVAVRGIVTGSPILLAPMAVGALLWHRYARLPGLSSTDSRLYRRIRPVQPDHRLTPREILRYSVVAAITTVVALLGGVFAEAFVGELRGDASGQLPVGVQVTTWAVALGLVGGTVGFTTWRLHRRGRGKAAALGARTVRDQLVARSGRCQCWEATAISGASVEAYLEHHLEPVAGPPALAPVRVAHPEAGLETASCPQTGAVWLRLAQAPEGAAHLLRAPLGRGAAIPVTEPAESATGFYL